MVTENRDQLNQNIVVPFVSHELMDKLQRKDYFYSLAEKNEMDYPDTLIITKEMGLNFEMPFSYPVILKSSESVRDWDYSFDGQEKIYTIDNREELNETLTQIYDTGYPEAMIIQDMIPGNDENMYVLTAYSDQNGRVKMMCLGHVLLEEHTPTGKGNHAVIITDYNEKLMQQAKNFLESIDYVGYSNFDIKYDYRDGKYKFFEINTRQGRSNYYVTHSGFNIAKYLVEDYVYEKNLNYEQATSAHLWMVVPKNVAFNYVKDEENKQIMRQLIKEDKYINPLFFKKDLRVGRLLYLIKNYFSHYVKY